ncbi:DNA topoisomerase III [Aeromonas veronii]|uniref:type IA DNA topoisomerase n=1 Tax=Aeromonas veronii TaxID=654 RepID=UPI001C5A7F02|nr:type IA DNA topoisomerase [Aeromonas veronii]MBW3779592.1 DNA topoisomerase III [Aeromonas veronii]
MPIERLFIAEKPALGKVIAEALGNAQRQDGYFQCGSDAVTWCIGHILELAPPEAHNPSYEKWNAADLPLKLRPAKYQPKEGTLAQFKVVQHLIEEAREIVHAGDPDDEGQLLVDEVLTYCGNTKPVKRVLINDLNADAARKALGKLRDNSEFFGLSEKARARSIGDQLYGFNMSRAYTIAGREKGLKSVLSVGRVQTPILGLIVNRYLANKNHSAAHFYALQGQFSLDAGNIKARYLVPEDAPTDDKGRIIEEAFAKSVSQACTGNTVTVTEIDVEDKAASAPLPFSLLDLQVKMSKQHGLSSQQTLDITQSLREKHKAITYNRSDCNYLSSDQHSEAPATLAMLATIFPDWASNGAVDATKKGRAFNDSKVTAHTAIIPTATQPTLASMSSDERKVYQAISEQYLAQFLPEKRYQQAKADFEVNGHHFATSATKTTQAGWTVLLGQAEEQEEGAETEGEQDEQGQFATLVALAVGQTGLCSAVDIAKDKTKPLPLYTEATLLKDLQRVAKYVKDPVIKQLLKDKDAGKDQKEQGGIGTPATRAAMIETLQKRNFYVVEKKKLIPTELGLQFIQALPDIATTPDMTALWHEQQTRIEAGELTVDAFLDELEAFIAKQVSSIELGAIEGAASGATKGQLARLSTPCPSCKSPIINGPKVCACTQCAFKVWRTVLGKTLTDNQLETLIGKRKTGLLKGFTSKAGKKFDALLTLADDGKVGFEFEQKKARR